MAITKNDCTGQRCSRSFTEWLDCIFLLLSVLTATCGICSSAGLAGVAALVPGSSATAARAQMA